ncbi:MAG: response regulator transcription factor [Ignavibacteriales bacterium]|nr:response regulator transcription factor [Ignavibacteriales bacterium]
MKKLLIIEDEIAVRNGLKELLTAEGYSVDTYGTGKAGVDMVKSVVYDVILLDVMLPDMTGFDVCRTVRSLGVSSRILMLTARGEEIDKVLGLELGADDYMTKPFGKKELIARIRALLRRKENIAQALEEVAFDGMRFDFTKQLANRGTKQITMTSKEFKLLRYFVQHEGEVISRAQLLDDIWGYKNTPTTRTVDNYILSLRKKIEKDRTKPKHLITVHTAGYKFVR